MAKHLFSQREIKECDKNIFSRRTIYKLPPQRQRVRHSAWTRGIPFD